MESLLVVVVVVVALSAHQVAIRIERGPFLSDVVAFLAESAILAVVMIWVFRNLPHADDARWTVMIPGALLMTAGVALIRLITIVYFAGRLERVSDPYGALGLAAVFLAWLDILGRLLVAGISLNASGHQTSPSVLQSGRPGE